MDPITASLAAKVVAVLAPYVAVGAQEFVRNAGKDAYEKAKTMFAALRAKWTGDEEGIERAYDSSRIHRRALSWNILPTLL